MARDYTKYSIEGLGENLNKRQLVYTIVRDWAAKNNPSLEEIQATFPDEVQGAKGFIRKESEVKDPKRFNMREPLSIKNGTHIVVSNQWGGKNIEAFLSLANKIAYDVSFNQVKIIEKEVEAPKAVSKSYLKLLAYNNENNNKDFIIKESIVAQTNGKYTLSFHLDSDGDGVIDTYHFYDIKTKVSALNNSSPWDIGMDFGFTDVNEELTEHGSLEDFGFDSSEISNTLENMRSEFIKKYLNEASQQDWLNNAAVPFNKRDILKEDISSGNLVFEEGDENILPMNGLEQK